MQTIELKRLIDENSLDMNYVAARLFPSNKYPQLALKRVLKGESNLDSQQISLLSSMTNLPISKLYSGNFDMSMDGICTTFVCDNFTAVLDKSTWNTKVFDRGSLFHEFVLHKRTIPLSEYLEDLNLIINKHKNR